MNNQQGQSVIEIIVAMGIMIIIAATAVAAVVSSFSTTRLSEEETQASFFAMEGIEAAQSIRNQDWDDITNGNHGLSNSGGTWVFSGSSDDPDGGSKFTRVVAVADAQRDGDGDLVASGGTVDVDTKKITSTITWDFTSGRSNTVEMVAYLTNWQLGRSTGTTSGDQASNLVVDVSAATVEGGGDKEIKNITFQNTDTSDIVIDKITVTWDTSSLIEEIKIDGSRFWKHNNEGSPDGKQSSGTELDGVDETISASTTENVDKIKFDGDMSGVTMSMVITMGDASTKTVSNFTPPDG